MSFPPNLGITRVLLIDSSPLPSFVLPNLDEIHLQFPRNKMNGYSRIRKINTTKSKSVDFAELPSLNQIPRSTSHDFKFQQTTPNHNTSKRNKALYDSIPEHEDEDGVGEVFGDILTHNISSEPSYKASTEHSSLQNVVKKSRSKKRSNSLSEGYSKIHQQCDLTAADDDQNAVKLTSQKTCIKKKGKFLKACRRFLGL